MSKARRALAWSFGSQYLSTIIQFVTTIVISRLLTPAEVGIYSLAATFMVMGQLLRDFGSGQYIIQEKELTDDRIRAAFSVTLMSGWVIALLVYVLAPYAASFFEQPGVEKVMHLLALNFALIPFGSITMAYLQRKMQFRKTMIASLAGAFTGSATAISCAFADMSYLSLAWGALAGSVTTIIIANFIRPRELPVLPGVREVPRVLTFASQMSTLTVMGQLSPVIIDMIVGKLLGAASLGLLSRSQGVIRLFETLVMRGLHPVLTPLFAEKHRDGQELASSYLYGTVCLSGLAWPFYAGLMLLAPDFIDVLFGENWAAAAPLVQIACVGVMLRTPMIFARHVLVATGNISVLLRRQLITMPLGLTATFFAAHVSLEAVVLVSIPMALFWLLLILPPLLRIVEVGSGRLASSLKTSALVTMVSTSGVWLTLFGLEQAGIHSTFLRLLLAGLVGGGCYLVTLIRLDHPLAREGLGILKQLRGRANPKS